MTQQAREFPILLNRLGTLMDCELAVNVMTAPEAMSSDENVEAREFKAVTVSCAGAGVHGASKALFIQIMTGLVLCGKPEDLRVEWAPMRFSVDQEAQTVSAHLMVVGHHEFLLPWDDEIGSVLAITTELVAQGIEDRGESTLQILGVPEPKPHVYRTPSQACSVRALFVSLMLAAYDVAPPDELELYWRKLPLIELDVPRQTCTASATAVFAKRQRIVVAALFGREG
jgi:hypothetical protein